MLVLSGFPALDFDVGHDAVIFIQADDFAVGHPLQELVVAVVGFFPGFQLLAVAVGVCLVFLVGVQSVGDFSTYISADSSPAIPFADTVTSSISPPVGAILC